MKTLSVIIICSLIAVSLFLVIPDKGREIKVVPQEFLLISNPEVGLGIFWAKDLEGKEFYYEDTICIYKMGDTVKINSSQIRRF